MDFLEGRFLVATPQLLDPNFARTVVLLIQHSEQGALGVVLNRRLDKTVAELWKQVSTAPSKSREQVHFGGPVTGPLLAVHTLADLAEMEIVPGVFFAAQKDHLDALVGRQESEFRIFLGHSGWGGGQLEAEIAAGAWLTAPASRDTIFASSEDLWETVTRQIGREFLGSTLRIQDFPEDPSVN